MLGAPLPTFESGESPPLPPLRSSLRPAAALISSEFRVRLGFRLRTGRGRLLLRWTLSLRLICAGAGDTSRRDGRLILLRGLFALLHCSCLSRRLGTGRDRRRGLRERTGAGFFNTRTMATTAATSVAMLMMRSSLSFMRLSNGQPGTDRPSIILAGAGAGNQMAEVTPADGTSVTWLTEVDPVPTSWSATHSPAADWLGPLRPSSPGRRKNPIMVFLPARYCSSCLGFAAMISSMIFSSAEVSVDCCGRPSSS